MSIEKKKDDTKFVKSIEQSMKSLFIGYFSESITI
ncbi:hypothetical protein ES703_55848 [subsurface metagenome]